MLSLRNAPDTITTNDFTWSLSEKLQGERWIEKLQKGLFFFFFSAALHSSILLCSCKGYYMLFWTWLRYHLQTQLSSWQDNMYPNSSSTIMGLWDWLSHVAFLDFTVSHWEPNNLNLVIFPLLFPFRILVQSFSPWKQKLFNIYLYILYVYMFL